MKLRTLCALCLLAAAGVASATSYNFRQASRGLSGPAAAEAPVVAAPLPTVVWGTPNYPADITVGADGLTVTVAPTSITTGVLLATPGIPTTGKWYWEVIPTAGEVTNLAPGVSTSSGNNFTGFRPRDNVGAAASACYPSACSSDVNAVFVLNDVLGFAYDTSTKKVMIYRNNVLKYTRDTSAVSGTRYPAFRVMGASNGGTYVANFGSKPFVYEPPAGYTKLEP